MNRKLFQSSVLLVMVLLLSNATANVCDAQSAPCANQCICQGVSAAQLLDQYRNKKPDLQVFELPAGCLKTCWYWGQGNSFPSQKDWAEQCVKMYEESCKACQQKLTPQATATVIKPTATVARVTPTPTRTRTPLPTLTPTFSPTPSALWDLAVEKIVLLQTVEGGKLVAGKPGAARVYLNWPDPALSPEAIVEFSIDGQLLQTSARQVVRNKYTAIEISNLLNTFNFNIPAERFTSGKHTFSARAYLAPMPPNMAQVKDPNPGNNQSELKDWQVYATRSIQALVWSVHDEIGVAEVNAIAAMGRTVMREVYPISDFIILPNISRIDNSWFQDNYFKRIREMNYWLQLRNSQQSIENQADFLIGIYPYPYYLGESTYGVSHRFYRRTVLVAYNKDDRDLNSPSFAHEIGHFYLGGLEEYKEDPDGLGIFLPPVNILHKYDGQNPPLEDLARRKGTQYINFMGNAGTKDTWVNSETWNRLVDSLVAAPKGVRAGSGLRSVSLRPVEQPVAGFLLKGTISKSDQAVIESSLWLENLSPSSTDEPSDYTLLAFNASGKEVGRVSVPVDFTEADPMPFVAVLPSPLDADSIALKRGNKTLTQWARSANPPQVNLTASTQSEPLTFTWQATDADQDTLTYFVLYSVDDGQTWYPLTLNIQESRLTLETKTLAGCDQCRVKVIASDGWNATSVTSDPFVVAAKPPQTSNPSPTSSTTTDDAQLGWAIIASLMTLFCLGGLGTVVLGLFLLRRR